MFNNLGEVLKFSAVTQTELAEKTGLSRGFINRLVQGKVDPTQSVMENIADKLNMKVYDIFFNPNVILVLQKDEIVQWCCNTNITTPELKASQVRKGGKENGK